MSSLSDSESVGFISLSSTDSVSSDSSVDVYNPRIYNTINPPIRQPQEPPTARQRRNPVYYYTFQSVFTSNSEENPVSHEFTFAFDYRINVSYLNNYFRRTRDICEQECYEPTKISNRFRGPVKVRIISGTYIGLHGIIIKSYVRATRVPSHKVLLSDCTVAVIQQKHLFLLDPRKVLPYGIPV